MYPVMAGCGARFSAEERDEELLCRPPREPGIYILLVEVVAPIAIRFDRSGRRVAWLPQGCYAYVGSAWGPGGLEARLGRHLGYRRVRRLHWHIDRLLSSGYAAPRGYIAAIGCREESSVAACLAGRYEVVAGFGATDDNVASTHLFLLGQRCGCGIAEGVVTCIRSACQSAVISKCST